MCSDEQGPELSGESDSWRGSFGFPEAILVCGSAEFDGWEQASFANHIF